MFVKNLYGCLFSLIIFALVSGCGKTNMHHQPPKPKPKAPVSKLIETNGVMPVNIYVNVSRDRVFAPLDHQGVYSKWEAKPEEKSLINPAHVRMAMFGVFGLAMGDDDCANGCIATGPLSEFDDIEGVSVRDVIKNKLSKLNLTSTQFKVKNVIFEEQLNPEERKSRIIEVVNDLSNSEGAIFIDIQHFLTHEFDSLIFSSLIELYTRKSMDPDNFEYLKEKDDSVSSGFMLNGYIPVQTRWVTHMSNRIEEKSDDSYLIDMWADNKGKLLNKALQDGSEKVLDLIALSFSEGWKSKKDIQPYQGCVWMTLLDSFPEKCFKNGSTARLSDNRSLAVIEDGAFVFELPSEDL